MTGSSTTQPIDVSIAGASELRLVVSAGAGGIDSDHADWALARIECGGGGGDTTPPTITSRSPAVGATGVAVDANVTATFSEAMTASTMTTTTFTLVQQGQSTPLPAVVSLGGQTATLNPNANLLPSTTYTATVKGGASGVKDLAGNALAADVSWSFTTAGGGDTTPPTITSRSPAVGATGVAVDANVTATFSEGMTASTITTTTSRSSSRASRRRCRLSSPWPGRRRLSIRTRTCCPRRRYTATVKGGASGVKDLAGNALAADVSWSFTTAGTANGGPTPIIDSPTASVTWRVGDSISFSGRATDPEQGTLPASSLSWTLILHHCPAGCHTHTLESWNGVSSGSLSAPDHEHPSHLELRLTATDALGATGATSVLLNPVTVQLNFASTPTGLQLSVNSASSTTPFSRTVIVGSTNSLSAITPQTLGGTSYDFASWSHGGGQSHTIVAPASPATYVANYNAGSPPTGTYLSNLTWTFANNGNGAIELDKSNGTSLPNDGNTITLNGTTYAKGLGVHAVSEIRYALSGCERFKAEVGMDDEVGSAGSVVFEVYAGAAKVFDSGAHDGLLDDPADRRPHRRGERAAAGGERRCRRHRLRPRRLGASADRVRRWRRRHHPAHHHEPLPRGGCDRGRGRRQRHRHLLGGDDRLDHHDDHRHARPAGPVDAAAGGRLAERSDGDSQPEREPAALDDLHGHRQGRRLGRQGPGGQCARRRRQLELHHERDGPTTPSPT